MLVLSHAFIYHFLNDVCVWCFWCGLNCSLNWCVFLVWVGCVFGGVHLRHTEGDEKIFYLKNHIQVLQADIRSLRNAEREKILQAQIQGLMLTLPFSYSINVIYVL